MTKKILIVGSGAREHAIAKAYMRSPNKPLLYCCGTSINPGIKKLCTHYWVGDICAVSDVVNKAREWQVDFVIIGPEAPLEQGLSDALWENSIPAIGPKKKLAQIETNKAFTRNLLKKYQVQGAVEYRVFTQLYGVRDYLEQLGANRYVIKANGLMGGKGVKVGGEQLHSFHEAYQYCEELLLQGQTFVIEEKLIGQEFTLLCFCDGLHLIPMPLVQDHKRAYNNDEGPNTGGMGSYSFANHRLPFLSDKDIETAQHINQATMTALTAEYKEPYIGILYGSFMATKKGVQLIEFNARFGDPEALNVLAILDSDFLTICEAMIAGNLSLENVRFANLATVCKYVVPEGYPDNSSRQASMDIDGVKNPAQLYLAGVDEREDTLYLTGSRTAAVVGVADTIIEAEQLAEADVCRIQGPLFHREDIGTKELINRRIRQMQELRQQDFKLL